MDLAGIMVSVDTGPAAADLAQLAASLVKRFEAKLIGMAARKASPPAMSRKGCEATQTTDIERARAGEDLAQTRIVFDR